MQLVWTSLAQQHPRWIYRIILRDRPSAARRVRSVLEKAPEQLLQFPLSGRTGRVLGTRELTTTPLPYVIVYEVAGDQIYVLAIWHGAQRYPRDTQLSEM